MAFLIPAKVRTDDDKLSADFDAQPFFEQAIDVDLIELVRQGCGGDFAADYVAEYMQNHDEGVKNVFIYLRGRPQQFGEPVLSVCHVNEQAALAWLRVNRPSLWAQLVEDDLVDSAQT